jgi:BlaI family transcriptional regulator, penicillinase repressor
MGKHATPLPGGELEYAVLSSLWRLGTATARDLHRLVGEPEGLVYTTIAKVLDRLTAKGLVARKRTGKAFTYRARVEQTAVELARARLALKGLLGSTPRPPMATLVEAVESLDPQLLEELEKAVAARRRSQHGA